MGSTMLGAFVFLLALSGCLSYPFQADEDLTKYRLPKGVKPTNYDVTIIPYFPLTDSDTEATFDGNVVIDVTIAQDGLQKITLHAKDMHFKSIVVTKGNTELGHKIDTTDLAKYDFVNINMDEKLSKDDQLTIAIEYTGNMRSDMNGFYLSSYKDKTNTTQWIGTTQFEPVHARRAFPCFDEPGYKATFTVRIQVPDGYHTLSNMEIDKTKTMKGVDVYQRSEPMPTYLVAFVISKFKSTEGKDPRYNVWTRPEAQKQAEYAASIGWDLVANMDEFMGINYTENMHMPKLDMVALPDFAAGAMENWGLLTYRETALLWDENESTTKDKQRVATVVAHELSHQWFGDFVTLHWWSDTWLNEGFATYFEYHLTNMIAPEMRLADQFVVDEVQTAMAADSILESAPLTNPVFTPNQISAIFSPISYNKGGSVIRMLEHLLGHHNFRVSLNDYINSKKDGNSHPSDLWDAMDKYLPNEPAGINSTGMAKFTKDWFESSGYPIIHAKLDDKDKTKVTLTQSRFQFDKSDDKKDNTTWYVPISYTKTGNNTFEDTKVKVILEPTDKSKTITIGKDDTLVINVQATGYYRVHYDAELLKRIQDSLKNDVGNIHEINRAQLVNDLMNLARAGDIDYSKVLDFLTYLAKEDSYFAWTSAFEAFRFLLQRFPDSDQTGQLMRSFMLTNMKELLVNKTLDDVQGESTIETYNRINALKWACDLGHEACIKGAEVLFKNVTTNTVPANARDVVYCTAIRAGGVDEWETLWNKYLESNVAAEKVRILQALGCSKNETILNNYLELSITPGSGIRKQDAMFAFSSVYAGNYNGVKIAFDFLENNYVQIAQNYGGMNALGSAITGLAERLTSKKEVDRLKAFLSKNLASLKDVEATADASIKAAQTNLDWSTKYEKQIKDYLNKGKGSASMVNTSILTVVFAALLILRQAF